jgi:hypothetical protein
MNLHNRIQAVLDEHRFKEGRNVRDRRDFRLDTCTCGRWWHKMSREMGWMGPTYDEHVRDAVAKVLDEPTPDPFAEATRMWVEAVLQDA